MSSETIEFLLFGLIISGGMLIPGNIPNIISANKLNITSTEWAKFALPFSIVTMVIMFIYLVVCVGSTHSYFEGTCDVNPVAKKPYLSRNVEKGMSHKLI